MRQNQNFYLKSLLLLALILALPISAQALSFGLIDFASQFLNQSGNSTNLSAREQADTQEMQADMEATQKEQQADLTQCTMEANADGSYGGLTPSNGNGSSQPGSNNQPTLPSANEQAMRDKLNNAGIVINKADCAGQRYQDVRGGCTSVAGLPQQSVDQLAQMRAETGQPIILSGGTEAGHESHGAGLNRVDVSFRSTGVADYIDQHQVGNSWSGDRGTYRRLDNGTIVLTEGDHWHFDFTNSKNPGTAKIETKSVLSTIWQWFKIPTAEATFAPTETGTSLSDVINQLTRAEINDLMTSLPDNDLNQFVTKLPFDALNQIFSNLNSGGINDVLDRLDANVFNQISGNLVSDSVDNIFGVISETPTNIDLSTIFGQVSNQTLNQIFSNISPDIFSQISKTLPSSILQNVLGQLSGGSLNTIFNNAGGAVVWDLVGKIGGDGFASIIPKLANPSINSVLEILTADTSTGNLGNFFASLSQAGLSNVLTQGAPELVTQALNKAPAVVVKEIAGKLPASVASALPASVKGVLDGALGDLGLGEVVGGVVGDVVGGVVGGIAGVGLYVPVVEQNGDLMKTTKEIRDLNKDVKSLSIQICTHLRAINRIQARFETKEFAGDPGLIRAKATGIENYRNALLGDTGLIKTGYEEADGSKSSLIVKNLQDHIDKIRADTEAIALYDVKNSGITDAEAIAESIKNGLGFKPGGMEAEELQLLTNSNSGIVAGIDSNQTLTASISNLPILGRITKPLIKLASILTGQPVLAEPAPATPTDPEAGWNAWLKLVNPENNRYGLALLLNSAVQAQKNQAEANAREEYDAGQGFKSVVEECKDKVQIGDKTYCRKRTIITPATIVRESNATGLGAKLNQYIQADTMGEVGPGYEPDVTEIETNRPTGTGGGAPGPAYTKPGEVANIISRTESNSGITDPGGNPNPGPNPNPNPLPTDDANINNANGWWEDLLGRLNLGSQNNPGEVINSSGLIDAIIGTIESFLSGIANQPPLVLFNQKSLDNNQHTLYWLSANSSDCVAGNDWLTADTLGNATTTKKIGASVGKKGSVEITFPTGLGLQDNLMPDSYGYILRCVKDANNKELTVTITKQ